MKEQYLSNFQQNILEEIRSDNFSAIQNLSIGAMTLELLNVNSPTEVKRFGHIFSQCDLNSLQKTCYKLSRAGFIKDVHFGYIKELGLINNFKVFYHIQKIRVLARLHKIFGGNKSCQ